MGRRIKLALAGIAAVAVVTVGAVAFAADTSTPTIAAGAGSCTTDAKGICTLTHTLGAVPDTVVVSANTPVGYNGFMLNTVQGSYTAKDFKVRAMFTQTTPKQNGTIWVSWIAYGKGITPPPPPPTSTTVVPPTTTPTTPGTSTVTPPPPTTSTVTPPPTTTTPPPAGGCANPTKFDEQDGGDFGPYFVHNNAWNWQGAGSGQSEKMYVCDYNNWWVDTWGFAPSNGEVFMYPNTHLDINSMNGKPLSTWSQVTGKFAGKGPGAGSYNVAWDLWLNGVADKNSFELMVWTEKNGNANPAGTKRAAFTDPSTGQVYDVWWDGTHNDQAYLAFISQKTQLSGTVDLRAFITEAQKRGYLPAGDTSVNQIDYGIEVRDTAGATAAKPYRFNLTDFGLTLK